MIWLNVGCGPFRAPSPWINVDGNDAMYTTNFSDDTGAPIDRKPDVIAWSDNLPYENGTVDRIYAGHVLEHINLYDGSVDRTVREFHRVLKPGGALLCVGPDLVKCAEMVFHGDLDWSLFWQSHGTAGRGNPAGAPYENPQPGDVHLWSSDEASVYALLARHFGMVLPVGFVNVEESWPIVSRVPWQYAVVAKR